MSCHLARCCACSHMNKLRWTLTPGLWARCYYLHPQMRKGKHRCKLPKIPEWAGWGRFECSHSGSIVHALNRLSGFPQMHWGQRVYLLQTPIALQYLLTAPCRSERGQFMLLARQNLFFHLSVRRPVVDLLSVRAGRERELWWWMMGNSYLRKLKGAFRVS